MTAPSMPPGLNYDSVSRYFADNVPGARGRLSFRLIGTGRSNLTYLVEGPGGRWVMRRPPLGHRLPTAHDMAREYRILSALDGSGVPVPRTLALCEDLSVNEFPFFVMEYRDGIIIDTEVPAGFLTTPEERRRLSVSMVETLARLHAVNYEAAGLGDFGRPAGFAERQVRRFSEQWERSHTRDLPGVDEVARRLRRAVPARSDATIVHGDYRLGNIVLDPADPGHIVALLDWEMATLGDPLCDLAFTVVFWGNPDDPPTRFVTIEQAAVTAAPGFMTREELAAEYARISGRDLSGFDFYVALAAFKLGIIFEGIYARFLAGETVGEGYEQYEHTCEALMGIALDLCDRSEDRRLHG